MLFASQSFLPRPFYPCVPHPVTVFPSLSPSLVFPSPVFSVFDYSCLVSSFPCSRLLLIPVTPHISPPFYISVSAFFSVPDCSLRLVFCPHSFPSSTIPVLSHFPCPWLFLTSCIFVPSLSCPRLFLSGLILSLSPAFPTSCIFVPSLSQPRLFPLILVPFPDLAALAFRTHSISVPGSAYLLVPLVPGCARCLPFPFRTSSAHPSFFPFFVTAPPSLRPAPPGGGNTDFPRLTKQELKNIVEKLSKIVACKVFLVTFVKSRVAGCRGDEV